MPGRFHRWWRGVLGYDWFDTYLGGEWRKRPPHPVCNGDYVIFGWEEKEAFTHGYQDCPVHGPWPENDQAL